MYTYSLLIFFLLLFSRICVFGSEEIEKLQNTYCIDENVLVTATGKQYPKRSFESRLHFDLLYYMKDPAAAEIVYSSYKKHILPVLLQFEEIQDANEAYHVFSETLIETCLLFGHPTDSPEQAFVFFLQKKGWGGNQWVNLYSDEIHRFIMDANLSLYALPRKEDIGRCTVAIITTTESGGNYAVAQSIYQYLSTVEWVDPVLIDVEEIAKLVDPVMIATNIYTYGKIYSALFQKTNDFDILSERKKMNRDIQQFIPSTLLCTLKQVVAALDPDMIISTRAYTCDDIALLSLGRPFRLLHTDFEISTSLARYYRSAFSSQVRFWLPISYCPSLFKPLFEAYGCLDRYNERDEEDVLLHKIGEILGIAKEKVRERFEVIGCPCSAFSPIEDEEVIRHLQRKWGVEDGEIPVFIVMGKHGAFSMKQVCDELLLNTGHLPFKYFFLCGNNRELQEELQAQVAGKSAYSIHGLLNSEEMNQIMNICVMGISKAGGATVMEAFTVGCPLLLMHSYPWEEVNAIYLQKLGLGMQHRRDKPLVEQMIACLDCALTKQTVTEPWQDNLLFHVQDANCAVSGQHGDIVQKRNLATIPFMGQ